MSELPGVDPQFLAGMAEYFRASGDRKSKLWMLSPHKKSQMLQGSMSVGNGRERYLIIDHLAGMQPILINHDFLVLGKDQIKFVPTVFLDSNVVSYLHQYRSGKNGFRSTRRGLATRSLLTRLTILGWDYNPLFYLLEALSRNAFEDTFPYASQFMETMLQFHTMDKSTFLASGEVVADPARVRDYLTGSAASTLSELAQQHVHGFATDLSLDAQALDLQLVYMALLKAGIINCERQRPQQKMLRFMAFLNDDLGCLLSREAMIAALHFRGKAGNLIPITPGTKIDVKKRTMASAWDVMLLRMPEFFLSIGDQEETTLGYVCTSDSALQQVGSMFTLLRVRCFADEHFTTYPEFVFHHDVLLRLLGNEITQVLSQSYDTSGIVGQRRTIPDKAILKQLQDSLEEEAVAICQRGLTA